MAGLRLPVTMRLITKDGLVQLNMVNPAFDRLADSLVWHESESRFKTNLREI